MNHIVFINLVGFPRGQRPEFENFANWTGKNDDELITTGRNMSQSAC